MIRRLRLTSSMSSIAVLGIAIVVLLSGGGAAQAAARVTKSVSGPLVAGAAPVTGVAALRAQPSGLATLTWDPAADNTLTVDLAPTGLSPANPGAYHSDPYPAELALEAASSREQVC